MLNVKHSLEMINEAVQSCRQGSSEGSDWRLGIDLPGCGAWLVLPEQCYLSGSKPDISSSEDRKTEKRDIARLCSRAISFVPRLRGDRGPFF